MHRLATLTLFNTPLPLTLHILNMLASSVHTKLSIILICHTRQHGIFTICLSSFPMFPPSLLSKYRVLPFLVGFVEDGVQDLELVAVGLGEEEIDLGDIK
jgi:hypothetical protein